MPLTNKERQLRNREKQKANPTEYVKRLEADRQRERHAREKAKAEAIPAEWKAHLASENARVKAYKNKKESSLPVANTSHGGHAYQSAQAMGKALKKIKSALPKSPRKKRAVTSMLAREFEVFLPCQDKSARQGLPEETKTAVEKFYLRDDVSWQAPGRKDRTILRTRNSRGEKEKTYVQTRYLLMSLREAYALFEKESSGKISLAKFCDLRPVHVRKFSAIPHNVCVCSYHENIRLLLSSVSCTTGLPTSTSAFVEKLVCSSENKDCMQMTCPKCHSNLEQYSPADEHAVISYMQWQNSEQIQVHSTAGEAFIELKHQLQAFLVHVYVKRQQSSFLKKTINEVDGKKCALQVDFSENATLQHQDEVQSAHWMHAQATMFTAHAWISEGVDESHVIISDDLQHTKQAVHCFLSHLLQEIIFKHAGISEVAIFSDGASSQFKQRYLFSNLYRWENKFNIVLSWHFFATSHGKGVVDGVGGAVKGAVWRYAKTGKVLVASPKDFFEVARARCPTVKVCYVPSTEVKQNVNKLQAHWDLTVPVPNTHKVHCVRTRGPCHILVAETSTDTSRRAVVQILLNLEDSSAWQEDAQDSFTENKELQDTGADSEFTSIKELDLHVGDWVFVNYEGTEYPGEVVALCKDEVKVTTMQKSGRFWKWPSKEECIFIT